MKDKFRRYSLRINIKAVAKQRSRTSRNGHHYTPKQTIDFEQKVTDSWIAKYGGLTLRTPIAIEIKFFIKRPKSHYGTGRNSNKLKPTAPRYCVKKPDNDNVEKSIWDGLNKIAYTDDSMVYKNKTTKYWCGKDVQEFILINIFSVIISNTGV